jgi:hypothetical protein
VLFQPIYAGDRGTGVRVIYPDGRQVSIRDQVTERIWQRVYTDLTPNRGTLSLIPSTQQKQQLARARERWQAGNPKELWINPDARAYAALLASNKGDNTYHLLTGPLSEVNKEDWRTDSAERIELVDAALYGRFGTSIVHLQGFCLKVYPEVEHITATRHIVPAHRVLSWDEDGAAHICVLQAYLETWLRLRVGRDPEGRVTVDVLEDASARTDAGLHWLEERRRTLAERGISYNDSHSPDMAEAYDT